MLSKRRNIHHPKSMESTEYLDKLKNFHMDSDVVNYSIYMFKFICKYRKKYKFTNIYDIGSGSGDNSLLIRNIFGNNNLYSFDYVQHNLDHGVQQKKIINPVLTNIYELNNTVKNKKIPLADFVFLGDVIEHLEDPDLAIKNIYESLSEGGVFVLHTPNKLYTEFFKQPLDPTHIHEFYPKELSRLLKKHNFTILKFLPSSIPGLGKINSSISQQVAYSSFGENLFKVVPILGPSILVIAIK